jgi:hypothetical protein
MFNKRHYEFLARLVGNYLQNGEGTDFVTALTEALAADNKMFDIDRFLGAVSKARGIIRNTTAECQS